MRTKLPIQESFMRTNRSRHVILPGTAEPGSHPGARPGVGTRRKAPGGGFLLAGPGRAKPKRETPSPVGPPPAGETVRDQCKEDWAADEGGDLSGPIPGCLGWL
ncbi:hypothetical protein AMECASPLE_035685 [Ameca splendens]|uniref:Uncharacterized protein n=1 Tax=Ameca splendens TaxID=208324 RepID=A0ABV0XWE3_9TELE